MPCGLGHLNLASMKPKKGYGQFCPISRAAEILAERWTPLVIRELLCGSVRFNELQRGVPKMSSSLLSRRLKELEYAGIIDRRLRVNGGRGYEYHLTEAGKELMPVIMGIGEWAQRWSRDDLTAPENLDSEMLMWDVRRAVLADQFPDDRRTVVHFDFTDAPSAVRRFWLVFDQGTADLCAKDPGFDVDLYVYAKVRSLVENWLGHVPIAKSRKAGDLRLEGSRAQISKFSSWFCLSIMAPAGQERPGKAPGRRIDAHH